jgi:hypothetical protein
MMALELLARRRSAREHAKRAPQSEQEHLLARTRLQRSENVRKRGRFPAWETSAEARLIGLAKLVMAIFVIALGRQRPAPFCASVDTPPQSGFSASARACGQRDDMVSSKEGAPK